MSPCVSSPQMITLYDNHQVVVPQKKNKKKIHTTEAERIFWASVVAAKQLQTVPPRHTEGAQCLFLETLPGVARANF